MTDKQTLTGDQILAADLPDWRMLLQALHTRFATGSFVAGLELANAIGAAAEAANHHPDLDLRYPHLDVRLSSHDVGGLTERDVALAREISRIAAEQGVAARPAAVSVVELGLDTPDQAAIKPFWTALLGGSSHPAIWFQATEAHETPRQRFHLDVIVPHDVAEERIAAALAAGGTLVSDAEAPAFWVLADADGNKACICTWQGRG